MICRAGTIRRRRPRLEGRLQGWPAIGGPHFSEKFRNIFPNPRAAPFLKPPKNRRPISVMPGCESPRHACPHPPQNRVHAAADDGVRGLLGRVGFRDSPLHDRPLVIADIVQQQPCPHHSVHCPGNRSRVTGHSDPDPDAGRRLGFLGTCRANFRNIAHCEGSSFGGYVVGPPS
jgi:hypothetical protein